MLPITISKILVALDLSEVSFRAWEEASELAIRFKASLEAIHVLDSSPFDPFRHLKQSFSAKTKKEALKYIRSRIGMRRRVHVVEGPAAETILRVARDIHSDLIVMGTHGRTGIENLILGSVAETVIRNSPIPVLTVGPEARTPSSILAPVAFTHYAITGLGWAALLASQLKANLTALHVISSPSEKTNSDFFLTNLIARLPTDIRPRCRAESLIFDGDPAEAILAEAQAHDIAVLVFHQKSHLKDWLFGTTIERVLKSSPIPVLSVPYVEAESADRKKIMHDAFSVRGSA